MAQPEIEVNVTEVETPVPTNPVPAVAARLGSIRVRVRKVGTRYNVEIPPEAVLPGALAVHSCMKPATRAKVPVGNLRYDNLASAMNDSISQGRTTPAEWADAIGQAMVQAAVNENPEGFVAAVAADTSSIVELAAGAPAYIAVGDMLFRLTPTAAVDKSGPLAALRLIAKERADTSAKLIIDAAKAESVVIIRQAERLKQEAASALEKAARTSKHVIPEWLSGAYLVRRNYDHGIEIKIPGVFMPERFTFEAVSGTPPTNRMYEWKCPKVGAYRYEFWLPFNPLTGRYNVSSCRLDEAYKPLPHLKREGLCGKVEGIPDAILSDTDLARAITGIVRAMNGFNMNSPLTHYSQWDERVRAFVPPPLLDFVQHEMDRQYLAPALLAADENSSTVELLNQTWTR